MNAYRLPDDSTETSLARLSDIMDSVPAQLRAISEESFSQKPAPGKWSPKEIIGHLVDSATNNHHRFVRAQFEDKPMILYPQELWNRYSYYQLLDGGHLISLWEIYNRHILAIISHIPADLLRRECLMAEHETYSIAWLFDDYVRHLEHHLRQIFGQPV